MMRDWIALCEDQEEVLPPDVVKAFEELGDQQRGEPERAMLRVQFAMGGGVLNPVVEHVGDITHRMSHMVKYGTVLGREKIIKTYDWLATRYGFEREFEENLRNNARYREVPETELRSKVTQTLRAYAEAHAKLPVYNRAQWLAREAAISVGMQQWDNARQALAELKRLAPDEDTWTKHALEYHRDSSGHLAQWAPS